MKSIPTKASPGKRNQRYPFSLPFSERRMAQPGSDQRTPPKPPTNGTSVAREKRQQNNVPVIIQDKLTQFEEHDILLKQRINDLRIDWYEGQLPPTWSQEEAGFFANWRRELGGLHETLLTAVPDQHNVLKKAHKWYCRLAFELRRILKWNTGEAVRQ